MYLIPVRLGRTSPRPTELCFGVLFALCIRPRTLNHHRVRPRRLFDLARRNGLLSSVQQGCVLIWIRHGRGPEARRWDAARRLRGAIARHGHSDELLGRLRQPSPADIDARCAPPVRRAMGRDGCPGCISPLHARFRAGLGERLLRELLPGDRLVGRARRGEQHDHGDIRGIDAAFIVGRAARWVCRRRGVQHFEPHSAYWVFTRFYPQVSGREVPGDVAVGNTPGDIIRVRVRGSPRVFPSVFPCALNPARDGGFQMAFSVNFRAPSGFTASACAASHPLHASSNSQMELRDVLASILQIGSSPESYENVNVCCLHILTHTSTHAYSSRHRKRIETLRRQKCLVHLPK